MSGNASAYPGHTLPTIELILSEIRNIKDDLLEQKKCVVCVKGSEFVYRVDDLDKKVVEEKTEREKVTDEINKKLEIFTQIAISTLVAAILNLLGIIALFLYSKP